jgi:sugar (glycoside-pentoside-hexuronide) transporter
MSKDIQLPENGMRNTETNSLPFKVKFWYGGAEGAGAMIWILFYLFFMFFLTDVVKLDPALAGFILMLATTWDAASSILVGVWSDKSTSRWGRRRPFILGASVPFGVIAWLLFTDFGLGPVWVAVYFCAMVVLFFTSYSVIYVPYSSLAGEMTQDYDERMSLVSYRMGWGQVFGIAAASLPLILAEFLTGVLGSPRAGWSTMAAGFGLLTIPLILVTWRSTRGYELFPEETGVSLRDIIDAAFQNRSFRYTLAIWTASIVATNVGGAMAVYFFKYRMGFDEATSSLALFLIFTCGLLWIPVINAVSSRYGKRWACIIFSCSSVVIYSGVMIWVGPETEILFWILLVGGSYGTLLAFILGLSMIPDVVEVDEFKTGYRREGLYFGLASLIQKVASALALWVIGIILSWVGYVPEAEQTSTALWGIRILYCEGVAFFLVIAVVAAYLLPLTREKHTALREAIEKKKSGAAYDTAAFHDIL